MNNRLRDRPDVQEVLDFVNLDEETTWRGYLARVERCDTDKVFNREVFGKIREFATETLEEGLKLSREHIEDGVALPGIEFWYQLQGESGLRGGFDLSLVLRPGSPLESDEFGREWCSHRGLDWILDSVVEGKATIWRCRHAECNKLILEDRKIRNSEKRRKYCNEYCRGAHYRKQRGRKYFRDASRKHRARNKKGR